MYMSYLEMSYWIDTRQLHKFHVHEIISYIIVLRPQDELVLDPVRLLVLDPVPLLVRIH